MLRPEYLEALPEEMVKLYRQVEDDILADMARRISTYDYYIPSAEHQRQKLREMGMLQSDILKTLSEKTGRTEELLKSMTLKATVDSLTYDQKIYISAGLVDKGAAIVTDGIKSVVNSGYAMTAGMFKNITRTTANTATKQFENALDRAWLQVRSGAFDYNTAIRRAVKDLAGQGIQSIRYPSGHVDTLEVAVRRAVLTGVNQSTLKAQWAKADEVGCDLVEVSAHAGARPSHAVWQGGIYSRSGESDKYPDFISSTGYGEGDGLGGWNCRHNFRPYIDGQPRTYSPELLSSYEAKDISYNGKKYTEYEASQIQRHIERNIRRWKRENVAMAAAGEDTAQSAAKIAQWQATMRDFINQTGFKRQSAREQIPGFSNRKQADAVGTGEQSFIKLSFPGKTAKDRARGYAKYIDAEYRGQKLSKQDHDILWDKNIGYIQSPGYKAINDYLRGEAASLKAIYKTTMDTLERVTRENALTKPYLTYRKVKTDYLHSVLGVNIAGKTTDVWSKNAAGVPIKIRGFKDAQSAQAVADEIKKLVGTPGAIITDAAGTSVSMVEDLNYFTHYPVKFEIQTPAGTRGLITDNFMESEFISQFGSSLELLDSKAYNDGEKECILISARMIQK